MIESPEASSVTVGRLLVLGAGGFIGSNLCRKANEMGWEVLGVGRSLRPRAGFMEATLTHDVVGGIVERFRPTCVIHAAGSASVKRSFEAPLSDLRENAETTAFALEAIRAQAPCCRFVLLSSAAVYGNPDGLPVTEDARLAPISPYGFSKASAELLCAQATTCFGTQTRVARIFSTYGPGLRRQLFWDLLEKFKSGGVVHVQGTGEESRDFIHIDDLVEALLMICGADQGEWRVFNVGSGVETRVRDVVDCLSTVMGRREVAYDGYLPPGTPSRWRADVSRLVSLGFSPRWTLDRGGVAFARWGLDLD